MKKLFFILFSIILFSIFDTYLAQNLSDGITGIVLNSNNISIYPQNNGQLSDNGNALWNYKGNKEIISYQHGLQIVGKINGKKVAAIGQWRTTFSPGPIINNNAAMIENPADSALYRIYKINYGDDSSKKDYSQWPKDFGAPTDKYGNPLTLGDQNVWSVFNSLHDSVSQTFYSGITPLPIEVQQYIYSYNTVETSAINDVVFLEYTIINKGTERIDSAFVGFFSDIDLDHCYVMPNYPAIDIDNQLAYCWTDYKDCNVMPVAAGYTMLYGPRIKDTGKSAVYKGKNINNFSNMPITAFHAISDDSENRPLLRQIKDISDAWNFANGLDGDGKEVINPITSQPTKLPFDGDPVTDSGWLLDDKKVPGGGAGFLFYSGPFNLEPQDTQWVMFALVPGTGKDGFEAITSMRDKAKYLQSLGYDGILDLMNHIKPPLPTDSTQLPRYYYFSQNYPNPFNPSTQIDYSIPVIDELGIIPTNVSIVVYDILGSVVATLVNENKMPGNYSVAFNTKSLGYNLSSGIYIYRINAGTISDTRKMLLMK